MKFNDPKIFILLLLIFISYLYAYLPEYDYIIGEIISTKASSVLKDSSRINYEAKNAIDGNLATAWCFKGSSGNEYIEITMKPSPAEGIIILNGLGKTRSLYYANNRVKDFEIEIVNRENKKYKYNGRLKDNKCGYMYIHSDSNMLKYKTYEEYLKDACKQGNEECKKVKEMCTMDPYDQGTGGEKLIFNDIFKNNSICIEKIILKVKNVYKGKVYNDTCISEIRLLVPPLDGANIEEYYTSICGLD